jgi:hypothetical protein
MNQNDSKELPGTTQLRSPLVATKSLIKWRTGALFGLQIVALLICCVFAAVFNSHLKVRHPSQIIGGVGLLFSIALFGFVTLVRISQRRNARRMQFLTDKDQ